MSDKDKDPKEEAGPKKDRKDVKDELKRAKTERDEYLDGWKRAKADLINYKRDELRRLEQVVQFANEDMISDIITVIDSFELAIASMEKDNPAVKGTEMIKSKLEDVLKKRGVSRIIVNKGDKFDPNFHEAVTTVSGESEKGDKPDTIAEEFEAGYMLYGKVIKASKVKVFK